MRRVLAILGAAVLLFSLVGGTAANAPFKQTEHTKDAGCFDIATPLGSAEFSGFVSDLGGEDAYLAVWSGEIGNSDVVLERDWDQAPSVVFEADTVAMTIPLLPSGEATVAGTLTPADTIQQDDRFRDANSWYRSTSTGTVFAFTGTLALPGVASPVPFGPEGCGGSEQTITTFVTQPHARVGTFTGQGGFCELTNDQGGTASVFLGFDAETAFVDGSASDGTSTIGFFGGGELTGGSTAFSTIEYDPDTGEDLPTTGSVEMTLTDTGETFDYTLRPSNGFVRVHGSLLDVGGTLETSVGTFSLEACVATLETTKVVTAPSNGPKPGGKRPVNDLPSGAISVSPGFRATVATKGAQMPSEAGYPCLEFTDPFDGTVFVVPVEYTVWYRLAGTGAEVTVDTAGSDFDTVVGVYADAPDAAHTVACVDDTPLEPVGRTLQASATFPTSIGTTYWIQLGGLDEDVFGPDPFVPYGTLKVAIR